MKKNALLVTVAALLLSTSTWACEPAPPPAPKQKQKQSQQQFQGQSQQTKVKVKTSATGGTGGSIIDNSRSEGDPLAFPNMPDYEPLSIPAGVVEDITYTSLLPNLADLPKLKSTDLVIGILGKPVTHHWYSSLLIEDIVPYLLKIAEDNKDRKDLRYQVILKPSGTSDGLNLVGAGGYMATAGGGNGGGAMGHSRATYDPEAVITIYIVG